MSHSPVPSPDLPRSQAGPNPQHLLVTLLGDYWHGQSLAIPSGALVELLGEFGISAASARSTISRLARRGILDLVRDGRSTAYAVRETFLEAGAARGSRILRFGSGKQSAWDGRWTMVTFSMPDHGRRQRESLRTLLRARDLAPVQDGLWVGVRTDEDELRAALRGLGVAGVTVFTSVMTYPEGEEAARDLVEWPLDALRRGYEEFTALYSPHLDRAVAGTIPPVEALAIRTSLMDTWRALVRSDPDLPDEVLPRDWPLSAARTTFATVYDALGPLAELRVRQIVGGHDPDLAANTRHITTSSGT